MAAANQMYMMLQIEKVNPAGVKDRSYLSERFPTVLTKMSLEPGRKILNLGPSLQRCKNVLLTSNWFKILNYELSLI